MQYRRTSTAGSRGAPDAHGGVMRRANLPLEVAMISTLLRRLGLAQIFISHSCKDHELVHTIAHGLNTLYRRVIVDPFDPGDRTCIETERSIKKSTHFVLLNTSNSIGSRWVQLESLFAKLCHEEHAIFFIPICVDAAPIRDEAKSLIAINWSSSAKPADLIAQVTKQVRSAMPRRTLPLDEKKSYILKEEGRECERMHYRTGDFRYNHKAIDRYEEAIKLNLCNQYAWANLAWALWKQREDRRARKCIGIAESIDPTSNHVRDVKDRIRSGKRTHF